MNEPQLGLTRRRDSAGGSSYAPLVERENQEAIIAAACKLFTDRGWSELALGRRSFTVQKEGKVFSCFLYPTTNVMAFASGAQRLSAVIPEPNCLVLTMEEHHVTQMPIYVGVRNIGDIPALLGGTPALRGELRQLTE